MVEAARDENFVPTLLAVSSSDGETPVPLYADPTTHRLYVDLAGAGSGDLKADGTVPMTADFNLDSNNLDNVGVVMIKEQAAADADVAGSGQVWVKTAIPNQLWFTDDAGTDFQLGIPGAGDLLADGTIPLTANWDVGAFTITGTQFISDIATGTAPFVVASTTEVANLKAATATLADTTTALATARTIGGVSFDGTANITVATATGGFTVSGGVLALGVNNITMTGTLGLTGSRLTKGWFTDLEVTGAIVGSITGNAATVTTITGLAPDTATTQATQANITTAVNLVSVGALNSGSITSGFTSIDVGAGVIITTGDITGGGIHVTGDTAAGDNAALGYTAIEGLILTGQGSTNDVTLKNDADGNVLSIPTGSTNLALGIDGTINEILMTEKSSIALDPAGGADGDYSGITFTGTGGETAAFGDVLYLKAADSEWYLVDADAVATSGTVAIAIAVSSTTNGNPVTLMSHGIIRADAGFPALTIGAPVYISLTGTTTNTVTVTAPSATDDVVRIVGYALTANEMLFNPSPDHITIV